MSIIDVNNLNMEFKIKKKQEGLKGSFRSLFKSDYTINHAVKDISFRIEEGDFVGLVGSNGAGKTTILKILSGILHPTSGNATVMNYIPWERKNEFKRKFSIVMGQRSQLWWDLPAIETFYINKDIYGIPDDKFKKRIDYLTELLDVKSKMDVQVRRLSLGERMKMELIASLIHYPQILFLDEPTIGLDVLSQRKIREFLKTINKEDKITIILTSHYMADILELCRNLIIVDKGTVIYNGLIQDIFKQYGQLKTISFSFEQEIARTQAESLGEMVELTDNVARYKVKSEDIQKICQTVLNKYIINDINIQETSIEDIICDMFNDA